jgi:hypothetical protein
MAFETLADLRARLNADLGVSDGSTEPFFDRTVRSAAVRSGFERLSPTMSRFLRETVTITDNTREYDLASITDVQAVELIATTGVVRELSNWRAWGFQEDEPLTRLTFAASLNTSDTLRVTGYRPYVSTLVADDDDCDLAPELTWIPLTWARAELYRRKFHEWLDFKGYNAGNPSTTLDPATLYQAYQDAARLFEQAKVEHGNAVAAPHRARLTR